MDIGNGVTSIDDYAFSGCSSLTNIIIPDKVISIGDNVFSGCKSLTNVTIGVGVISIKSSAFKECSNLTSINWNATNCLNTDLYYSPIFYNCAKLEKVAIGNNVESIPPYCFYECTNLATVIIPNSVASIGKCAFYHCSGLTSVTIGNGAKKIGEYAFSGCKKLMNVTIKSQTVPILANYAFFSYEGAPVIIYVPADMLETYKADAQWSKLTIEAIQ